MSSDDCALWENLMKRSFSRREELDFPTEVLLGGVLASVCREKIMKLVYYALKMTINLTRVVRLPCAPQLMHAILTTRMRWPALVYLRVRTLLRDSYPPADEDTRVRLLAIIKAVQKNIADLPAEKHFDSLQYVQLGIVPWIEDQLRVVPDEDYDKIVSHSYVCV